MAIYHCNISNVSRAKGSASTATLSYITGERVEDERLGKTFYGFGRQERIEHTGVILPEGAPEEFLDPAVMFNSIELFEKTDNARTGKKIEVALPRECSLEQQIQIMESYIRNSITENHYAAVYAIHCDKEGNNPHAHILIPNRQINSQTHLWEKTKTKKEYALNENGERIPVIDPETGEQKVRVRKGKGEEKLWQRISVTQNPLDKKEFLEQLRESWAQECNKYLAPDQQIDHRSNKERGIEYEPTIHEGYAARQIEQRGAVSDRVQINEGIREINRIIEKLKELGRQIADLFREKGAERHDRIAGLLQRSRSGRSGGRAGEEHTREGETSGGVREPEGESIESFLADINAQEQSAAASRADRDAEQLRSAGEGSRKAPERTKRHSRFDDGPSL